MKKLPPIEELNSLFEDNGITLIWRVGRKDRKGKEAGWLDDRGYRCVEFNGNSWKVHRILWAMRHGHIPEGMYIDHKDGNKSNNSIENLRLSTNQQNTLNVGLRARNSSGHKNVKASSKNPNKWEVSFRNKYVGTYNSLEEAAAVARKWREELHGEFCNHGD